MTLIIYFTLLLFLIIEKLKAFRNGENRLSKPSGSSSILNTYPLIQFLFCCCSQYLDQESTLGFHSKAMLQLQTSDFWSSATAPTVQSCVSTERVCSGSLEFSWQIAHRLMCRGLGLCLWDLFPRLV